MGSRQMWCSRMRRAQLPGPPLYLAQRNSRHPRPQPFAFVSVDIPAAAFWSFTLYDNQTRSMLQTPQRFPRAGSQSYPSPAAVADADGSTTVYFGPTKPADAKDGNWIQTMPGKGWFMLLRLYSPREPFFTKAWRPTEVTLVR
jgi:hypothetical protein